MLHPWFSLLFSPLGFVGRPGGISFAPVRDDATHIIAHAPPNATWSRSHQAQHDMRGRVLDLRGNCPCGSMRPLKTAGPRKCLMAGSMRDLPGSPIKTP